MSELTIKLLELINQKMTVNEISESLGLSHKQIYNLLSLIENSGFQFLRGYFYDGNLVYYPKKKFIEEKKDGVDILTTVDDTSFTALVISDLHIGSKLQRLDLLNVIYEYCAKNSINIIIICGDLIDGMFGKSKKIHDNSYDQINYAIKNYPFDKNILNFVLLGDHDYYSLNHTGQDFARVLNSRRHDIIPLGYGTGKINIKNDSIKIRHKIHEGEDLFDDNNCFTLIGHLHTMRTLFSIYKNYIVVPSLSDIRFSDDEFLPGAMKMTLQFNNGYISKGIFSQLLVDSKVYTVNSLEAYLGYGKDLESKGPIKLEVPSKKRMLINNSGRLNKVDKFGKKFSNQI